LAATAEEIRAAECVLSLLPPAFLAVHPGSGSPRKNWPAENFAVVVAACAADARWLLVEGPADSVVTSTLRSLRGAVVASDLPPRVLGAALARSGAYVGNDSGVSHLAAAWGAPTVALFGPTDPARWSPVGEDVRVVTSPTGAMDGIPAGAVIALLATLRPT
jgi:ADP-heptose:LPS heptosyltransferase